MSKHDRTPQQAAKAPPADVPTNAAGRWYRIRRGKGEYAAYFGVDVLEIVNGRPEVREFAFPAPADIAEGKVVPQMFEEAREK